MNISKSVQFTVSFQSVLIWRPWVTYKSVLYLLSFDEIWALGFQTSHWALVQLLIGKQANLSSKFSVTLLHKSHAFKKIIYTSNRGIVETDQAIFSSYSWTWKQELQQSIMCVVVIVINVVSVHTMFRKWTGITLSSVAFLIVESWTITSVKKYKEMNGIHSS